MQVYFILFSKSSVSDRHCRHWS